MQRHTQSIGFTLIELGAVAWEIVEAHWQRL